MPTLGIYIQVPFCASKCSFCNFSSRVERSTVFDHYTRVLVREIEGVRNSLAFHHIPGGFLSYPVDSIYIGGGTPTLLGGERLRTIVQAVKEHFCQEGEIEFTVEATPASVDYELFCCLREIGVNRLSIGAQSFNDQELRAVARLHSADDTVMLVDQARRTGCGNISLDLIAGLPFQTERSFQRSLEDAAELGPEHLSLYLFEVDEKSRLGREVVHAGKHYYAEAVPTDEFMADAYESGCAFLGNAGYVHYEISNFALPGFESRHNQKYWQRAPYFGLGAGAHSFDGARRWANQVNAQDYMAKVEAEESPIDQLRFLTTQEQVEEFFFLGLRQRSGVSLGWARDHWGHGYLKFWEDKVQTLVRDGMVICDGDGVRLSQHALLISNEIFQEFVSA